MGRARNPAGADHHPRRPGAASIRLGVQHPKSHIFEFDLHHLERCDAAVLLMPAGKSAHLELGFVRGLGKPGYIVFDKEPERIDVMYQFATELFFSQDEFFTMLATLRGQVEQLSRACRRGGR